MAEIQSHAIHIVFSLMSVAGLHIYAREEFGFKADSDGLFI